MLRTSIRDILTGKFRKSVMHTVEAFPYGTKEEACPGLKEHQFYLFSDPTVAMGDGTLYLYIGQSNHPLWVAEHCACLGDKTIGKLIEANVPWSHDWQLTFFTTQEATDLLRDWQDQRGYYRPYFDNKIKTGLIQYYNPCLNIA